MKPRLALTRSRVGDRILREPCEPPLSFLGPRVAGQQIAQVSVGR